MEIITVCSSVRFRDEMMAYRDEQLAKGKWVLLPENMDIDIQKIDQEIKRKMDILHLAKIDLADEVLIWNRNGYIGESTKTEIHHALLSGAKLTFLESD